MAVHATLNDLAAPVEFGFVFSFDARHVGRSFKTCRLALPAGELGVVCGVTAVHAQHAFERGGKARGHFVLRILLMFPETEASI